MSIWTNLEDFAARLPVPSLSAIVETLRSVFVADPELRRQVAFSVAMIALSAKMAKADGVVTPDEVGAFMRGEVGGLASIVAHQNVWARQRAVLGDGLVVVRYEDLHADARGCLQRIAALAGLGRLTDGELDAAIDGASFGAMRDLERSGAIEHAMLRPGDAADPESFKVRRGKVGGFVDYLDADDCAFMDAYIEATLAAGYGYRSDERGAVA